MSNSRDKFQLLLTAIEQANTVDDLKPQLESIHHDEFSKDQLDQLYLAAVTKFPLYIAYIPKPNISHEMALIAVKKHYFLKKYLPEIELQNYDIHYAAVSQSGWCLEDVPMSMRDKKMCMAAIADSGLMALAHVPDEFHELEQVKSVITKCYEMLDKYSGAFPALPKSKRDLDSCIKAVNHAYQNIIHVPEQYLNRPEFKQAIEKWQASQLESLNNDNALETIKSAPPQILTQEICNLAAQNNMKVILNVPFEYRTYALFKAAISKTYFVAEIFPYLYQYQKNTKLTKSHYKSLLDEILNDDSILELDFIPAPMKPEIYLAIISKKPEKINEILELAAKNNFSKEQINSIIDAAINKDPLIIKNIPTENHNYDRWLAIIKNNPLALEFLTNYKQSNITEEQYVDLCKISVKRQGLALKHVLPEFRKKEINTEAVKSNGLALEFIAIDDRQFDLMLDSVNGNGFAIQFIDHIKQTNLTSDQLQILYLAAVKKTGLALKYIPEALRNKTICSDAVEQNGLALEFVPKHLTDFDMILTSVNENGIAIKFIKNHKDYFITDEQYVELCLTAVKRNYLALKHISPDTCNREMALIAIKGWAGNLEFIPERLRDREICLLAVQSDGDMLKFVPMDLRDDAMCLAAVKSRGLALEHVPIARRSDMIIEESVKQNVASLTFIEDNVKLKIIEKLGFENLLISDFSLLSRLPEGHDYHSKIKDFLSTIKHIVVTKGDLYSDIEVKDAFRVYSESAKRKGKTIHVNRYSLNDLLKLIDKYSSQERLNLVLLGHATTSSDQIADLKVSDIIEVVADNTNINTVTLLGCNSAKSLPLEEEKVLDKNYREQLASTERNVYSGVALMSDFPEAEMQKDLFKKMATDEQGKTTNTIYVIVTNKTNAKTNVVTLQRDAANNQITSTNQELNDESFAKLSKLIGNTSGKLPPTTKRMPVNYYRGGKATSFLSPAESEQLTEILHSNEQRYSKQHPKYKQDKKAFPFMTGISIDESEEDKLQSSLLQKVTAAIRDDYRIQQEVDVKGYTKAIHVDTKERQMKVFRTHLYDKDYKGLPSQNFFTDKLDNINRKKLAEERKIELDKMTSNNKTESSAKSITVRIKK